MLVAESATDLIEEVLVLWRRVCGGGGRGGRRRVAVEGIADLVEEAFLFDRNRSCNPASSLVICARYWDQLLTR